MTACPLCGSRHDTRVRLGVRHGPELEVRACEGCGFRRLSPQPSDESLASYYEGAYRAEYDELPVDERFLVDRDEASLRVERLSPLLRREASVLEVGAGSGAFLDAVCPFVDTVVGVEPDVASRAFSEERLGATVVESLAEVATSRFDLIVMFHVLEHVPDPIAFLRSIRALSARGGKIVIEVPNVDDALLTLYRIEAFEVFYYQRAHLWYFAPKTLWRAADRAGLVASIEGVQRYDLANHVRWALAADPSCEDELRAVFGQATRSTYARALVQAMKSDTLWMVAERREGDE